ncbi:MAG: hypothetical protein ACOC0P_01990, partial [Planctomycetota bacterium]
LTVIVILVAANVIMAVFNWKIAPLYNPDTSPLPFGVRFATSILLCSVSLQRARDAGGRGVVAAWLQLLFFLIPGVVLATIYLMFVQPEKSLSRQDVGERGQDDTGDSNASNELSTNDSTPPKPPVVSG